MHRMRNKNNIKQELQISGSSTRGENLIQSILLDLNYHAIKETGVTINGTAYSYDFSIWHNGKLQGFIEYDGELHFHAYDHFGGVKELEKRQQRDVIKNEFCKKHNLKLLRIAYDFPKTKTAYTNRILEVFPESKKSNDIDMPSFLGKNGRKAKRKTSLGKKAKNANTKTETLTYYDFAKRYDISLSIVDFEKIVAISLSTISRYSKVKFKKVSYIRKNKSSDLTGIKVTVVKGHTILVKHPISKERLRQIRHIEQVRNEAAKLGKGSPSITINNKVNTQTKQKPPVVQKARTYEVYEKTTDKDSFEDIMTDNEADLYIICRTRNIKGQVVFEGKLVDTMMNELEDISYVYDFPGIYKAGIYGLRDYIRDNNLNSKSITLISRASYSLKPKLPKVDKHDLQSLHDELEETNVKINHLIGTSLKKDVSVLFRKNVRLPKAKELPFFIEEYDNEELPISEFAKEHDEAAVIIIKAGYETDIRLGYYKAILFMDGQVFTHEVDDKIAMTPNRGILLATKYILDKYDFNDITIYLVHNTDLGFNQWKKNKGANVDVVDEVISTVKASALDFRPIRYYGDGTKDEVAKLIIKHFDKVEARIN